jgi:ABC-type uncharacterized transport system involved in gliding motility auxiliary subunit
MKNKFVVALLIIGGIVLLNIAASFVFFRLDLTEEKRYSLSDATQSLLENLSTKDSTDIFVKV